MSQENIFGGAALDATGLGRVCERAGQDCDRDEHEYETNDEEHDRVALNPYVEAESLAGLCDSFREGTVTSDEDASYDDHQTGSYQGRRL